MRVLVVDNYDSFTYNLVQYLGELGAQMEVVRNDRASVDELLERGAERLVVSPGPCTPNEAGVSVEAMRRFPEAGVPALGVCLGHQSLAQAFGGRVIRHEPVHGKSTEVEHDGRTIFTGLESPLTVGRYHSLVVDPDLPECFERTAEGGGVVMGIRHRGLPAEGVQFHPESVLTPEGKRILQNFLGGAEDDELVALVRRSYDLWNQRDLDAFFAEVVAPDIELRFDPRWPEQGPFRGRQAFVEAFRRLEEAFGGASLYQAVEVQRIGPRVLTVVPWRRSGQTSGADFHVDVFTVYSFAGGRIVRQQHFLDRDAALAAAHRDD